MDDGEESRRGEGRLCTHGLRHLWVARANPSPRTYVCTSRPSPARPTLYSARLERYRYPYLVASSRTSAPVTHRRSSDPLPGRTASSPRFTVLLRSLFPFSPSLSLSLSLSLQLHFLRASSPLFIPAILSDRRRRAFFAYPFEAYVMEQIGDGESYVGPYLRLSRPMYRDRGGTCDCSHSRVF